MEEGEREGQVETGKDGGAGKKVEKGKNEGLERRAVMRRERVRVGG